MSIKSKYYLYQLVIEGEELPFYAGKTFEGSNRFKQHITRAKNNVDKGLKVHIINKALRENKNIKEQVLVVGQYEYISKLELFYILKLGRRDLGTGILANHTNGGDGGSGRVFTDAQRKRLSECSKGNTKGAATKGKPNPKVALSKHKQVHAFSSNGFFIKSFVSGKSAASYFKVSNKEVSNCCRLIKKGVRIEAEIVTFRFNYSEQISSFNIRNKKKSMSKEIKLFS